MHGNIFDKIELQQTATYSTDGTLTRFDLHLSTRTGVVLRFKRASSEFQGEQPDINTVVSSFKAAGIEFVMGASSISTDEVTHTLRFSEKTLGALKAQQVATQDRNIHKALAELHRTLQSAYPSPDGPA